MSLIFALALTPSAHAACDSMLGKVGNLSPEAAPGAFTDLAKCDKKMAEANFNKYMERAKDADALVGLFSAAIDADVWNPVWNALSKITSYDARDEVARRVGESCTSKPKVVAFLEGAYFGLRDIEFQQWDDAYSACSDPGLAEWVQKQVEAPPNKMFDEKFNALMDIFVKARRSEALPSLAVGAVKAAESGPFDPIIQKMSESVAPDLGAEISADDRKKLEDALVSVASQVPVEKARAVADQLANAGADEAAAKLLSKVYPDRVQAGGAFVYGALVVEAGDCDGKKSAFLHYAMVTEPGKRWSIVPVVEGPLRGAKAKLGKCSAVESPWPVISTPEPLKSASEVDKWVDSVQAEWERKGYAVKTQKEKPITL